MTDQTRAKQGRRNRRSASQLFLGALVVFGVIASVLLLFSENVQWMRVGVLSALWAAVIGAFAMTKYRRESAADQTRAKDLQTVYELQLAREIAARREYELSVEARVRNETRLEADDIAALRNELAALRQNLQVLFEGNLPTERVALRAEATRMQELGGRGYGSYQPAPSGLYVPGGGPAAGSSQEPRVPYPTRVEPAGGVGYDYDEPVTAETSVLYPEDPNEMPQATAVVEPVRPPQPRQRFEESPAEQTTQFESPIPAAQARPTAGPRPAGRVTPPTSPFTAYNYGETRPPTADPVADAPVAVEPFAVEPEAVGPVAVEPEAVEPEAVEPVAVAVEPLAVEPEVVADSEPGFAPEHEPEVVSEVEHVSESGQSARDSLRDSADAFFGADPASEREIQSVPDEDAPAEPRRGRRRAAAADAAQVSGAHSNGRSVAEIMAGLSAGEADTGNAATDQGTRRRRRRAD